MGMEAENSLGGHKFRTLGWQGSSEKSEGISPKYMKVGIK
jgi:hypothetical protein